MNLFYSIYHINKTKTETMSQFNKTLKNSAWCTVCKAVGRPESEYTSHFVKDKPGPEGVVVCEYLLSMTCRYCKKTGHTPKHCHVLKRRNKHHQKHKVDKRKKIESFVTKPSSVVLKTCDTLNAFELLSQESGDDEHNDHTSHEDDYHEQTNDSQLSVDTNLSDFDNKKTWAEIVSDFK